MPRTDWGWQVTPGELRSWTIGDTPELLVINKPGLLVCHPSKRGPWSSLIGAVREYTGLARVHMPFRLDRETSGVMLFAKDTETGKRLGKAVEQREYDKNYVAILTGDLHETLVVDQPLGPHPDSQVRARQSVVDGGLPSRTVFTPLARGGGYTLARVEPETGRMHQIRVHAAWAGYPLAGDKLYGPDETLFLEFAVRGFTERLATKLPLPRHALHCFEVTIDGAKWRAPLAEDLVRFAGATMSVDVRSLSPPLDLA